MGKDREQRLKVATERNREYEAKYGGDFHQIFGGRWPEGPNRGQIAADYLEWSHVVGLLGRGKRKEK